MLDSKSWLLSLLPVFSAALFWFRYICVTSQSLYDVEWSRKLVRPSYRMQKQAGLMNRVVIQNRGLQNKEFALQSYSVARQVVGSWHLTVRRHNNNNNIEYDVLSGIYALSLGHTHVCPSYFITFLQQRSYIPSSLVIWRIEHLKNVYVLQRVHIFLSFQSTFIEKSILALSEWKFLKPIALTIILILYSELQIGLLPKGIKIRCLYAFLLFSHACLMPRFDRRNDIWREIKIKIKKLVITESSPVTTFPSSFPLLRPATVRAQTYLSWTVCSGH